MSEKRDVESGERTHYPTMLENPELRWFFIRKVYSILTFQLLLTVVVASVLVFVRPVANFFINTTEGYDLYHVLHIAPWISAYLILFSFIMIMFFLYLHHNLVIYCIFRIIRVK